MGSWRALEEGKPPLVSFAPRLYLQASETLALSVTRALKEAEVACSSIHHRVDCWLPSSGHSSAGTQLISGLCYAFAKHPLILNMHIHDLVYFIQLDPLSGLFNMCKHTRWLRGASCLSGPVS
jgi:hypothetical protein